MREHLAYKWLEMSTAQTADQCTEHRTAVFCSVIRRTYQTNPLCYIKKSPDEKVIIQVELGDDDSEGAQSFFENICHHSHE